MESETDIATQTDKLAKHLRKKLEISVSKSSWRKSIDEYRRAIVIKLATGDSFNVYALANILRKAWNVEEKEVEFEEIPANLAVAKFKSSMKLEEVLEGGPWSFHNCLVIIKRWVIGTKPENLDFSKVHTWIQLHNVPTEYMAEEVTKEIAEGVGKVVKERQEGPWVKRRKFARYKVEIDINQELPEGALINLEEAGIDPLWVDFKYERLPPICGNCRVLSHKSSNCQMAGSQTSKEKRLDGKSENLNLPTAEEETDEQISGGVTERSEAIENIHGEMKSNNIEFIGSMEIRDACKEMGEYKESLMDIGIGIDDSLLRSKVMINKEKRIKMGKGQIREEVEKSEVLGRPITTSWAGTGLNWNRIGEDPNYFVMAGAGTKIERPKNPNTRESKGRKAKNKQTEVRYQPYNTTEKGKGASERENEEEINKGSASRYNIDTSIFNLGSAVVARQPRREQ